MIIFSHDWNSALVMEAVFFQVYEPFGMYLNPVMVIHIVNVCGFRIWVHIFNQFTKGWWSLWPFGGSLSFSIQFVKCCRVFGINYKNKGIVIWLLECVREIIKLWTFVWIMFLSFFCYIILLPLLLSIHQKKKKKKLPDSSK